MRPHILVDHIIKPTMHAFEQTLPLINKPNSIQLMLAIAAQESDCGVYFKSINGHEMGIWQVHPDTDTDLHENFLNTRPELLMILNHLKSDWMNWPHIQSPMYNCAIARLCLYRYSEPCPPFNDMDGMWKFYKKRYNSYKGAATEEEWIENWNNYVLGMEP